MYSDVCLKSMGRKCYCVDRCVYEVQGEGYVTVHRNVCMRCRMREMLMCTVMCV